MLGRSCAPRAAQIYGDTSSVAALEFAIILPLMLILLAGVYDLSEALIIRSEVYNAAQAMDASASNLAVQSDGSTALTYDQVQQVESTIWALVPTLRQGLHVGAPISITMSSITMFPNFNNPHCNYGQTASCDYIPSVVWSESYVGTGTARTFVLNPATLDCGTVYLQDNVDQFVPLTNLADKINDFRTLNVGLESSTFTSSPPTQQDEAGPPPFLVVAIQYTYVPLFTTFLKTSYTFWADGYWPVRSVKNTPALVIGAAPFASVTLEPLSRQYTTLVGNATSYTLSGSDINSSAYCVNKNVANPGPVSNPVSD